jgi:hypothetical protein
MTIATGVGMDAVAKRIDERAVADRDRWCRFGSLERGPYWTPREVELTIRCAADRWNVDVGTALAIAERESHLGARALNPYSKTCGVFQHVQNAEWGWAARVAKFNRQVPHANAGPSCFNGRSNVLVSLWMMGRSGFGPWAYSG